MDKKEERRAMAARANKLGATKRALLELNLRTFDEVGYSPLADKRWPLGDSNFYRAVDVEEHGPLSIL